MNEANIDRLAIRHPGLLRNLKEWRHGVTAPDAWYPLIDKLFTDLSALPPNPELAPQECYMIQNSGELYCKFRPRLSGAALELYEAAYLASRALCVVCAAPVARDQHCAKHYGGFRNLGQTRYLDLYGT